MTTWMKVNKKIANYTNKDSNTKPKKDKDSVNYARIVTTVVIGAMLMSSSSVVFFPPQEVEAKIADKKEIKIASWNLQNFAGSFDSWKRGNADVRNAIQDVISPYDVIFVQELREDSGSFNDFNALCAVLGANYACHNTPKITGAGSNSEGYGVIYKTSIENKIASITVEATNASMVNLHIPQGKNTANAMVRPPMKATIEFGEGNKIIVFSNHDDPSYVTREMQSLEYAITNSMPNLKNYVNVIVLGDLNADGKPSGASGVSGTCNPSSTGNKRYDPGAPGNPHTEFVWWNGWHWIIPNDRAYRTNFGVSPPTGCVYDRIILNDNTNNNYYSNPTSFGVVGIIPNNVGVAPNIIPAGTEFGNKVWGPSTGKNPGQYIKQLSDHRLVWAKFNYGGVESTGISGDAQSTFTDKKPDGICDIDDEVYARGVGFVPNKNMDIYITKHPGNKNISSNFKTSVMSYALTDERGGYTTVTTDGNGNITNTQLWVRPIPDQAYNIIVDVNRDGNFTNSLDVVDVFNQAGFSVNKCEKKQAKVVAAYSVLAGNKIRDFITSNKVVIGGIGLTVLIGYIVNVYITDYTVGMFSSTTDIIPLNGTTVEKFSVLVNQDGTFDTEWSNPKKGQYNIVVDVDKDGKYTPGVDVVDYPDEIGFIVFDSRADHNDIVHLGDNGLEREVYNTGIVQNIYTLVKNLPADQDVDIYTISERLLKINNPGWTTWESSSSVDLLDSTAPVYEFGERVQTANTSSDGTLFLSTWKDTAQIFDQPFINYYGKKYNIVIDVNQDGLFNPSTDKVDTHDIGDMKNWFASNDVLDSSANGNVAVSEYKEYLNDKLDLENLLDTTNDTYDSATEQASFQYLCSNKLTTKLFQVIEVESQVGIRVLNENEYYEGRDKTTGRHIYDQVEFGNLDIQDGNTVVITFHDDDGTVISDNLTLGQNSNLFVCNVDDITIDELDLGENSDITVNSDGDFKSSKIEMEQGSKFHVNGTCIVVGALASVALGIVNITGVALGLFTGGGSIPVAIAADVAITTGVATVCGFT